MLKLPHRRFNPYRNSYYRPKKTNRQVSLLWLGLAIPASILLLELGARMFFGLSGRGDEVAGISPVNEAYRLKFLTENQQPIAGLPDDGRLVVKRSSSFGYQLLGNQKTPYWNINPQGFRDRDPLPLAKPKNEIRVFILGGSAAFGQGTQKNEETIAHQLETLLKQRVASQEKTPEKYRPDVFPFFKPDREKLFKLPAKLRPGQYRVINAAVPGYSSGNELAQLALEILPYQPDIIVVLDGYSDLILPSHREKTDVPQLDDFLENASGHFQTAFNSSLKQWLDKTYLVKTVNYLLFKPQPSLANDSLVLPVEGKSLVQHLPNNEQELNKRIKRYQDNQKQLISLAAKLNIPVIVGIQPEITGVPVEKLSSQERSIRDQLGTDYLTKMSKSYEKLAQGGQQLSKVYPNNVKVQNFYYLPSKFPSPVFIDAIHLTNQGNKGIAQQLYTTLTSWEKMQIIPQYYYLKD
jgi:lysophospholipase L1-like esterase